MPIMKKPVKITLFSIGGTATVALILAIVLGLNYFFNNFGEVMTDIFVWLSDEDVPQPEQNYGEFPFKIVYETNNGEQITVEDTLVIEYLGYGYDFVEGKHSSFNFYILSEKNKNPKERNQTTGVTICQNNDIRIIFDLGNCEYYMGLSDNGGFYVNYGSKAGDIIINGEEGKPHYYSISDEELYEKYNIKIIEKRLSPPLKKAG